MFGEELRIGCLASKCLLVYGVSNKDDSVCNMAQCQQACACQNPRNSANICGGLLELSSLILRYLLSLPRQSVGESMYHSVCIACRVADDPYQLRQGAKMGATSARPSQ